MKKVFYLIFGGFFIIGALYDNLYTPYLRYITSKRISKNSEFVVGSLVKHSEKRDRRLKGGYRAISIVEFSLGDKMYTAEMDRLKVITGIELKVRYNVDNPEWNRVIIPDSLEKYRTIRYGYGEERFYTWPPYKADVRKIGRLGDSPKGPY